MVLDLPDLLDNLKEREHALSKTALKFLNAIGTSGEDGKDLKLVFRILHETLIKYKDKKNAAASSIILSCMHFLISKWDDMGSAILERLPSLLKVFLQRICSVDEDVALLTEVGWDVLKYLIRSKNGGDDSVAKWFIYGISQLSMKDTPCSCRSSSPCTLSTLYIGEFQAMFVRLLPHNEVHLTVYGLLLKSFERHCHKKKLSKFHIANIVDCGFDILNKASLILDDKINCDATLRKVVTHAIHFGGNASLQLKNAKNDLHELSTTLDTICVDSHSQCDGMDGIYSTLFDFSLTILSRHIDFCQSFSINSLTFLRKLCGIIGYCGLSNEQLLRLGSFLHRNSSEQSLELCLQFFHEISQKSNILKKFQEGDDALKFLGSIFGIGTMIVNGKSNQKFYELTERLFQNVLTSLSHETFSVNSEYVPMIANLGVVLVKVHRIYGIYSKAMKAAETTIKMIPYDTSMHLIDQWVKAKYSNEKNPHQETLATSLKGNVPRGFLIKILMRELDMYIKMGMHSSSISSVTAALLECDHALFESELSYILRCHIKAKFEIGDLIDFDQLLNSKVDDNFLFEDTIQIRILQFLQQWHTAMEVADYQKRNFDIDELRTISIHLKRAADSQYELKSISETCKTVHEAHTIARLFGHNRLAFQIIDSLYRLLQHQNESNESKHVVKLNICSALCEMAACSMCLKLSNTAQKYADLAATAWDSYERCLNDKMQNDGETEQSKHLYYKVQAIRIKILYLRHRTNEAKRVLKRCLQDDYLEIDNVKTSVHALYCSCIVYEASFTELDPAELRMINLLDLMKRLSSLRMTVLPNLHNGISTNKRSIGGTQRFGFGLNNMCFDLSMQLSCLTLLFRCLRHISKTYILLGDPDLAKAYINNGFAYAKSLYLKDWYMRFLLLKLQLASMGDHVQYSDIVELFCKTAKCDCKKENSWTSINEDMLGEEKEEYEISFNEDDIENEVLGSNDSDAILIPTKKIKILDDKNYSTDISSTPKVRKRLILKNSKVLSYLSDKSCSCVVSSTDDSTGLRMKLGIIHANYCLQNSNFDEAMNVCSFCLNDITKITKESTHIDVSDDQFWSEIKAELMIAKAAILLATKKEVLAMAECESVRNFLSESYPMPRYPSCLKAKLNILCSNFSRAQDTMAEEKCDIKQLNSFIDALSQPDEVPSQNSFATPVLSRRRKILSAKTSATKAKSAKMKRQKSAVADDKENFAIYEDNRHNKLPVPQFHIDRSPSPHVDSVYDIDLQETQNIRITRKAARSRFKKKHGTTYTEEAKERVRGRTTTKKSTTDKTPSRLMNSNPCKDSVFLNFDHTSNLEDALENASSLGDFNLTKVSAQALSQCHFQSYQTGAHDLHYKLAATYHMLSVGITTRSALNLYIAKINKRSSGKKDDTSWNIPIELSDNLFKRVAKKDTKFINELQQLLPEKWTVCVISVTEPPDDRSKILITRLRRNEIYHTQMCQGRFFDILQNFNQLMARNIEALKSCDRSYWWTQRRILDEELKTMVSSLPGDVLGQCVGVLRGSPIENERYEHEKLRLIEQFPILRKSSGKLSVALDSWYHLTIQQKLSTVKGLIGDESDGTMISLARALEKLSTELQMHLIERGHVILIPGKHVQLFPWESTPLLHKSSVTRMPCVDLLKHQLTKLNSPKCSVLNEGVDMNDVSYVLNPNGDLKRSEERIQEWFQHMKTWKGIVARVPDNKEWICSITDFDLFIYCGHGSGDRYISGRDLQKVETRAAALLMGCNSAKLYQDGLFEPNGIVLNYLISGAPCVVGCLWKVTDKDIDQYLRRLLEKWADGKESPVSASAIFAREGMRMPYINGAACVVYGLPIHCQASAAKVLNALPKA